MINSTKETAPLTRPILNVNPNVKVLIGFKCPAELKLRLSRDANSLNLSLSEFCEGLLINYSDIKSFSEKTQVEPEKLTQLNQQIGDLTKDLAKYECNRLKQLLKHWHGRKFDFTDYDGNHISIEVKTVYDVFNLMLNSFKPAQI
jgi:hypothetical protein